METRTQSPPNVAGSTKPMKPPNPAIQVDLMKEAQQITLDELLAIKKEVGPCNERGYAITGFTYPRDHPLFYVKYPRGGTYEAVTQQFVYDSLQAMDPRRRQNIHVPKIYRIIPTKYSGFIIMELVHGSALRELQANASKLDIKAYYTIMDPYFKRVSQGLQLLVSLQPPPNATPSPVGGGYLRHPLFADFDAPMEFDSIDTLELYINKLATWFSKTDSTVTLERKLVLVFSDLHMGNFMFTDDGALFIIDFADAAFLPPTFLTYTLLCPKAVASIDIAAMVRHDFDLPMENLPVMQRISQLTKIPVYKLGFRRDQDRATLTREFDTRENHKRKQEEEAQKKKEAELGIRGRETEKDTRGEEAEQESDEWLT